MQEFERFTYETYVDKIHVAFKHAKNVTVCNTNRKSLTLNFDHSLLRSIIFTLNTKNGVEIVVIHHDL